MEAGACNPQIKLAESAEVELSNLIEQGKPRYSIFAKNELGQIILNSIFPEQKYLPDENCAVTEYYRRYRETITENLNKLNGQENSKAKDKWIWFARLFNENIKYFSSRFGSDVTTLPVAEALLTVSLNYLNPQETSFAWMEPFKNPGMTVIINPSPVQ